MPEGNGTAQAPVIDLDTALPVAPMWDIWAPIWAPDGAPAEAGLAWLMMRREGQTLVRRIAIHPPAVGNYHIIGETTAARMIMHSLKENHANFWSREAMYVFACWPQGVGTWYTVRLPEELRS